MRFPRIWVTLPGLGSWKRQKSKITCVQQCFWHVDEFQKIHEHLLQRMCFLVIIALLPRGAVAVALFPTCAKEVGVDLPYIDPGWDATERLLGGVRKPTESK